MIDSGRKLSYFMVSSDWGKYKLIIVIGWEMKRKAFEIYNASI